MAQGENMATFQERVTTKRPMLDANGVKMLDKSGKDMTERVIQAVYQFEGPEKQEEYDAAPPTGEFVVTARLITPNVVVSENGVAETVIPEANKMAPWTYTVQNHKAWRYGAGLLAGAPARQAAEAGTITDHKITFAGKVTDLDTLSGDTLITSVSKLAGLSESNIDIGTTNTAKLNHKIEEMVKAGLLVRNADGSMSAPRKNGKR